tara:strand:- start:3535 stop:3774 length:240 start_codon:yes stop_codon:yes gene_type:complete
MRTLLIEAGVVGLATIVVGVVVALSLKNLFKLNMPISHKNINKNNMVMLLFITGFLIHIICEFSGLNKWYCSNGNACLN